MPVTILEVPYDSGQRDFRAGRGPAYLLEGGVRRLLGERAADVEEIRVEADPGPTAEIATSFALHRRLAAEVARATGAGRFPVVLAGNCNCILGVLGGLGPPAPALLFFDAHGDFNTPDTTVSGFLDGMGLAAATGRCWKGLAAGIEGFQPLPDARVALVGARDVDPAEREALDASRVAWIRPADVQARGAEAVAPFLERLRPASPRAYLHFDMDVLDPTVARANRMAAPGGLTVEDLEAIARAVGEALPVAAVSVASVEPGEDDGARTRAAVVRVLEAVIGAAGRG